MPVGMRKNSDSHAWAVDAGLKSQLHFHTLGSPTNTVLPTLTNLTRVVPAMLTTADVSGQHQRILLSLVLRNLFVQFPPSAHILSVDFGSSHLSWLWEERDGTLDAEGYIEQSEVFRRSSDALLASASEPSSLKAD